MSSLDVIYVMAAYFLLLFLFGSKKYKYHSFIIMTVSVLNSLFQLPSAIDVDSYLYNREVFVLWDGATALILCMFLKLDKTAWKQALLLAFATLCHIMIILSIKEAHAGFFYTWYDELIIAVGILQMMVSYDGLINALSNLQELLLRTYHCCDRSYQSFFTRKDSEKRA